MASFGSSPLLPAAVSCRSPPSRLRSNFTFSLSIATISDGSLFCGQRLLMAKAATRFPLPSVASKSNISCSIAQPETLQVVQATIAKQLSRDESTVIPQTKFTDLGADSLDIVEIMMTLEEKFGVSIGEGGAEGISTVQDAADLIEKVKASAAS
ncbi:uncharacterized protein LOC111019509 [Momordica charantia]|uniref:Acyl carrier protein n=1 Tax=Momordica charantia TaxID=3673 RepID=A0A6J1DF56_MOMCH|nr:uncharacterized protein LOC111019509 [Momordica charantia]WDW26406.1 acyl carrier protein [Momordica charantia]